MITLTPSPVPESSTVTTTDRTTNFIQTTLSYNSNLMLAAIISLLLVILFVLLLHIYARWFLVQSRQRSRSSVTVPHILASRLTIIDTTFDSYPSPNSNGLHPSHISSLPLFVYNHKKIENQNGLECAICISLFEEEEVGRKLPKCGHAFHVECIDMWLCSHSTCPICRAGVLCEDTKNTEEINDDLMSGLHLEIDVIEDLNTEYVDGNSSVMNESGARLSLSESESTLSGRLKRMLSTNRSEHKIHPSAGNITELEV